MTPAELREIGRRLYGERWQTALAREVPCTARTIRRLAAGQSRITERTARRVREIAVSRTRLHHVTLTTGHVAITPRYHLDDSVLGAVRGVLEAGGGELAGVRIRFLRRGPGAAAYELADGAVLATVCWSAGHTHDAWQAALAMHLAAGQSQGPTSGPPPAPWLAISILPQMYALPPELIYRLGDAERCVAWALIEPALQRCAGS